ncbi:MAG TPA: SRPBCC domain-containing protein [Chitinophagaceae bacterium]|jgi:uncharacterized protein YndB with AHSA1/START domain|nr:SRPBCC domain-containing protein [Chitinophagaceae bacterium]
MEQTKLTVAATVAAPANKAWDFFTQPEHITQWNFASEEWECPHAEADLREGGRYLARMQAKDGSFGFDFEAVYTEIVAPERITYRMTDGREATTDFVEEGGSTRVTTTFDADSEHDTEMQRAGWQAILDNFKKYAEAS